MAFGLTKTMPRKIANSRRGELERLTRERTAELERANERLFIANQEKAEFLAHITKELRNPIDRIIDLADALLEERRGRLTHEQRERLGRARECSARLRAMADRIIELSDLNIGIARFLKKSYDRAEAEAYTDPMTGLCNIRHFWQHLDRELERAQRYGHGCSIALIDIDFFKKYNDRYGHLQGDEVLREAAELLRQQIRNSDIAARYGGEEFVIIMPETGKELAMVVGEKLRKAFATFSFPLQETQPGGSLTISVGIATFPQDAKGARDLFDKADKALYRAKEEGRNRVVGWGVCLLDAGQRK